MASKMSSPGRYPAFSMAFNTTSTASSFVELSGAVLNAVAAAIQRSEAFVGAYFAAVGGPSRLVAQLGALGGAEVAAVLRVPLDERRADLLDRQVREVVGGVGVSQKFAELRIRRG